MSLPPTPWLKSGSLHQGSGSPHPEADLRCHHGEEEKELATEDPGQFHSALGSWVLCQAPHRALSPQGELTAWQWPLPARPATTQAQPGTSDQQLRGREARAWGTALAATGSSRRCELTVSSCPRRRISELPAASSSGTTSAPRAVQQPSVGWGEIRVLIHQQSPIQWFSSLIAIKRVGAA